MRITFFGGAREVTGSMHLVEAAGKKLLLECGLFEGRRRESHERNRNLPFDPEGIDCLILSHAHIDHSGNIPTLCKKGFRGNIYATHATRDLCTIMLHDSAHIQADDAAYLNKKRRKAGKKIRPVSPLYTKEEAERSLRQFVTIGYHRPFAIFPEITLTFMDAGHILGSAVVVLDIREKGKLIRFGFTGDIGRSRMPLIRSREPVRDLECLVMESTYGNRLHGPIGDTENRLADAVVRTHERGGKIIIPAFSVGRTQQVIHSINKLMREGRIPELPVFVDSPLSVNATEVFRLHPECYNIETYNYIISDPNPFGFEFCHYIRKTSESKLLNTLNKPCVIISSSGMCETGRILHHLKNNVEDPRNTVLIVNFCAEHTLGKRIVERKSKIKIFGEFYRLRAEVVVINAFSAHADRDELIQYVSENGGRVGQYILVHGEEDQAVPLAKAIESGTGSRASVPRQGDALSI